MRQLLAPGSGFTLPELPDPKPADSRTSLLMAIGVLLSPDGDILHADEQWTYNALHDAGETSMLAVYLREQANPTKYLALVNDANADVETKGTMTATTESGTPGSGGYSRQQIAAADWTDDGLVGGDARFSAAEKTFGPITGTALTATHSALCTTATGAGLLLATVALSATTTIAVGQSFKLIFRWTQS